MSSDHPTDARAEGKLLLRGARVLSPDEMPPGTCVAIRGESIVGVGPEDDALATLQGAVTVVDLDGLTVTPGFVDAHVHPMPAAFFEHHLDVDECGSLGDLFDLLSGRAAEIGPDGVVLALRLDDSRLAERRLPTRLELDAVSELPVVVMRRDGHHAVGSTTALAAAGFGPDVPDPEGGYLGRSADGSLDGLCAETASSQLLGIVPTPEWEELAAGLQRWSSRLASQGVTAIGAMCQTGPEGPAGAAGELEAVAWSALIAEQPFDVQTILITGDPGLVTGQRDTALHDPAAGRHLDAVKLFLDGTLGGHSACLHRPYDDRATSVGLLTLDPEDAYRRMERAHLAGLAVCVHAIGDRTNEVAVELFSRLLDRYPARHRHRIEHASLLTDTTVQRLAELGVTAVVQPISIRSERDWLESRLGDERVARVYRFRSLLDAGVSVAGSSDSPIEDSDVLTAMCAAVDRGGISPEQSVTPLEALAMYTTGAAAACGMEHRAHLAPGVVADLAVLSTTGVADWTGAEVQGTFHRGRVTHRTEAFSRRLSLAGERA